MKRMMNKNFIDFKTWKCNSLFYYMYCGVNERSSKEVVSIAFSRSFFHGNTHALAKKVVHLMDSKVL